ncbi:cell wall-associated NlpC family hydrolase [Aneurinibacillus soli]|uniref:Murein DD-endopeptidase MepH n=1 Tax=Aneurinibacillus soli TaxID=1500254 RepID=A0A0U5AX42_9BACL|nr:LysM peptidoglycan-binding domain-containing C40 family peptidase [Aneurinibacillus soli]PYE64349.1 cell wall-associated NlpC family hydrolase [Aneurinibacillus soli]BAU28298.1 Murein DD-endopeptidase MepH precursor [Aneurinibacillus soli]
MKRKLFLGTFLALLLFQGTSFAAPYDQYTSTGRDTFWSLAQRAGVRASDLQAINPLVDPKNIWKGLLINLPNGHKPMPGLIPASEVSRRTYTVRSQDTFWTISKKFGINFSYLIQANPKINDKHNIQPGLVINIPTVPPSISPTANWETKANYIIGLAKDQFDVPYVWGDTTPWVGLDCSSLTQYVFGKIGVNLPRTSNWQFQYGTPVAKDQLRKGDLVFFKEHGSSIITHVGIYMGNDQMINADTGPKDGVQIEYIFGDDYYKACYAGARRFIK